MLNDHYILEKPPPANYHQNNRHKNNLEIFPLLLFGKHGKMDDLSLKKNWGEKKKRKNIRFLPDSCRLVLQAFHRQRQAHLEFSLCALHETAETCHQVTLGVPPPFLNTAYKEGSAFPFPFCQSTA